MSAQSLGTRTKTLTQFEYNEILSKNPVLQELYQAVFEENTEEICTILREKGIVLEEDDNRRYAKLLIRTAVENDNDKVLGILFENGARVGGSLFTAVRMNAYKCVKVIVKNIRSSFKEGDVGPAQTKKEGFITPLMMALQLNYYDIVEYFIAEGYKIEEFEYERSEEQNRNDLNIDLLKITDTVGIHIKMKHRQRNPFPKEHKVLFKINTYQAIANPLYICYKFIHDETTVNPLYEIFRLNQVLLQQSRLDEEFKEYYKEESEKCEDFAVDLMEQCRTFKEIKLLTDVIPGFEKKKKHIQIKKKDARDLTFLNMAIKGGNEKLVAHPYSQLCLNMVMYKNIYTIFSFEPNWRDRSHLSVLAYTLRHILLLPFLTLVHVIAPCTRISKVLGNPVIKFLNHFWSTLVFVALLILSAFQDTFNKDIMKPSIPEWLILAWIVGMIFQEFKELWIQGKRRYFGQWWNAVTFLMMAFFVASYTLRLIAYGITGNWAVLDPIKDFGLSSWYEIILLSNSLFSIGMVLSFIRLSGALQANSILGPLQLSLYHLILDVFKFMVFFILIFLGFGLSLRKLYSHYISTQQYIAEQRKALNSTTHETEHKFSNVATGLYGLFWSLFGLTDLQNFSTKDENFAITKETGELLFGIFQVLAVIVAINMLIAMMTRSFDEIASNAIKKWKVSRTSLWMFWVEKGSILPPPLNLIPNFNYLYHQIKHIAKACKKEDTGADVTDGFDHELEESGPVGQKSDRRESKRQRKLKDILKRYIATRKIADNVYPRDEQHRRRTLLQELKMKSGSKTSQTNL